jgi:outer membrane protein assembly factor BamB
MLVQWDSTEVHFFRGDGDVPNLVGVASFGDGAQALVGLAGATGKVLWRSPSGMCDLFTDGRTRILRFETGKTFSRYDTKTGKQAWSIQLSDNLGGVALGEKCASLKLYMGQTPPFGIDTDTGKLAPCSTNEAPAHARRPSDATDVIATRDGVSLTGAVRTDSKPINPEPPRLAITARRGTQKLWETAPASLEPVWESGGFDRSIVFTPAGAFLFGRSAADHAARFALVDTASGRIVYEKPAPGKVESRVQVGEGGGLAFIIHDQRLEAYDAATGALRWSIHR